MDREFPTERADPGDRNGDTPGRAGNGFGAANGSAVGNGNGHGNGHSAVTGNGNGHSQISGNGNGNGRGIANGSGSAHGQAGHGNGHDRLGPIGASAVVRPVPGGEHKGMLKLVEFTQPANGAVSRNADQTLTYRPKPGFTGKDSFEYTLHDEAGTQFSATVTVAVSLDAPAFKPKAAGAPPPVRTPTLPPANNPNDGLPRLHGGTVHSPGE